MKSIRDLNNGEYVKLRDKSITLYERTKGYKLSDLITYKKTYHGTHYSFTGRYSNRLVGLLGHHPDADEIVILVDDGFGHGGASCRVNNTLKTFNGRVYM